MMRVYKNSLLGLILALFTSLIMSSYVQALGSPQTPQNGAMGLEATIPTTPPTSAATIAIPSSGQSFSSIPITVSGLCQSNLLIKIFDNNVFTGSSVCSNGSYSLKVGLFNTSNSIDAQEFNALGQGGPLSNTVNVTFDSGQYSIPGSQVIITSAYAELGADPGQQLTWPIIIGGGTPPYAISTTWGDGLSPTLQSSAFSGKFNISHSYSTPGIYYVNLTVSDNNGSTGFLQLVAVSNGQLPPTSSNSSATPKSTKTANSSLPWWVFVIIVIGLWPAFWLGNRHGKAILSRKFQ